MTRWARGHPSTQKKPHQATPWSQFTDRKQIQTPSKSTDPVIVKQKTTEISKKKRKLKFEPGSMDQVTSGLAADLEKTKAKFSEQINKASIKEKKEKSKEKKLKRKQKDISELESVKKLKKLIDETPELSSSDTKEISTMIKKEERREERRLKRIDGRSSSKMCFHCRQTGHDMSSCPEVKKDQNYGTGICFKCGSAEHTVNKCRVKLPPGEFPFAKCFICNEMGHLSKQCPDNPRGLYPSGGCCLMCGSVEHYKKDCPEFQKDQGIGNITLSTLSSGSVDDEASLHEVRRKAPVKKGPKIVKF